MKNGVSVWFFVMLTGAALLGQSVPSTPFHIQPEDVKWVPNPATPRGGLLAILIGKPTEPGRYVFRLKFPAGYKVMPHSHPDERIYTVLEGTWEIGLGLAFDETKLKRFHSGSVYVLPPATPHFHLAQAGESVVQINGMGPTRTDYVDPKDDPRKPGPFSDQMRTLFR
jgi:quercetin dioxygenase-like cupin family protein